ncbi:MAG TPA: hypothetical protein PK747_00170 [Acidobacteriota bacterium]|nr:hypothetical protein [Acidobacteriota bacterium]HQQ45809.1 hypothetical protein [Acidobacteriota bacterium]
MSSLNHESMKGFLSKSISSMNRNKINGLLAEVDLRKYMIELGFANRISPGGWIARREGAGEFGHQTVVFFPETIQAGTDYAVGRELPVPPHALHTICATFHQTGIAAYFCAPSIRENNDSEGVTWSAKQLGLPADKPYEPFPQCMTEAFRSRERRYTFLRYHTDTEAIPTAAIAEEFSKESIRIAFQKAFMAELSDVDGIFWGQQYTYPLEIKEKTPAEDRALGQFFGLDLGPFVKLSYYAAKRGNLHSIFIVREIDSTETRNLVSWWFITYERLAQYASWIQQGGGRSMTGGQSSVVRVPKAEFQLLNKENLRLL